MPDRSDAPPGVKRRTVLALEAARGFAPSTVAASPKPRPSLSRVQVPADVVSCGTSKSGVSRRFVAKTTAQLRAAPLDGLDLVALLLDGVPIGEHCLVVALGIARRMAGNTRSACGRRDRERCLRA